MDCHVTVYLCDPCEFSAPRISDSGGVLGGWAPRYRKW